MGMRKGFKVGIISDADDRFQQILSALGFAGGLSVEKPNPRIYEIALERARNIVPDETLHIGDSMRKDYVPAKSVGMHALLLDRFKTPDAEEWRKSGAVVLPDLVSVQDLLTSDKLNC